MQRYIYNTNSKTSKSSHWRLWEFDELIKTTREHTSIEPADAHLVQKKQQLFIFGHKDWKLQRPGHNLEYIYKSVHCHKKTHTCKRSFKEWKEKMKSSSQFFGGGLFSKSDRLRSLCSKICCIHSQQTNPEDEQRDCEDILYAVFAGLWPGLN